MAGPSRREIRRYQSPTTPTKLLPKMRRSKPCKILEGSRIGVLTGPAGTGKTTLLKIFLDQAGIVGPNVLLLAPTGKARVRLGQQTERPAQAQTLAQFLLATRALRMPTPHGIWLKRTGTSEPVTTCVVDECSMLHRGSACFAPERAFRRQSASFLVGWDPQQLPPIGCRAAHSWTSLNIWARTIWWIGDWRKIP